MLHRENRVMRRKTDTDESRIAELEGQLNGLKWVDWHACFSGDCQHDTVHDCLAAMKEHCEYIGATLRAVDDAQGEDQ